MAEWKKVIVSGSSAELSSLSLDTALPVSSGGTGATTLTNGGVLIGNGTGAITATSVLTNGQLLIGDGSGAPTAATLTAGTGVTITNGAGSIQIDATGTGGTVTQVDTSGTVNGLTLTGGPITTTGTITLGGTLSNIANSALTNDSVTIGSTEIDLGATATTITGLTSVTSTDFVGDLTGNADTATTANGVAANSVALGTDTTGDYVQNLGTGTGVTIGSNSGEGSQPTISVNYGSSATTAVEGDTTITINGTSGEIGVTGTPSQALGGAPSYTITLPDTITGDRTFQDNITVTGDLTVEGTASFQSTTNLQVADRFVLFASGSGTTGDGGIVVQQDTQDVGELFGYDSGTTRWGVTSSFSADNSAYTPDAFMAAVTTLASTNPNTSGPDARYDAVGNIYVSSGDESIWIYA